MKLDSITRNPKPKIDDDFVAICNLYSLIDFLVRHEWIRAKGKPIYNLQRFFFNFLSLHIYSAPLISFEFGMRCLQYGDW